MPRVQPSSSQPVTIRLASAEDTPRLARLAALDSARPLVGPALVAERDERLLAARSLSSGRTIADPFHPTADLIELLRLRAASLRDAPQAANNRQGVLVHLRRRAAAA